MANKILQATRRRREDFKRAYGGREEAARPYTPDESSKGSGLKLAVEVAAARGVRVMVLSPYTGKLIVGTEFEAHMQDPYHAPQTDVMEATAAGQFSEPQVAVERAVALV